MNIIILFFGLVVGIFGWAQIVGRFQRVRTSSLIVTVVSVVIWVGIMAGCYLASAHFGYQVAMLIGYGVGLVIILFQGRIE